MEPKIRTRRRAHAEAPATPTDVLEAPEARESTPPQSGGDDGTDYDVGYKKPPKKTQFKRGRSGNPRGRPKGTKNFKTELAEELQERVRVREGGTAREVSKQRAMLKRLTEKALHGDARSASIIVNMVARFLDQSEEEDRTAPLTAEDLAILRNFEERLRGTEQGGRDIEKES